MLVPVLLTVLAQLPVLRPEVQVDSGAPGEPQVYAVGVDGEAALCAWTVTAPGGGTEIWGALSTRHGAAWSSPLRLDVDPGNATKTLARQSVVAAGGTLFVAWLDDRASGRDAYLRARPRAAAPRPQLRLDDGYAPGAEDVQQLAMHVSDDGQTVLVLLAMTDNTPQAGRIVVLRSTDGGVSFAAPVEIGLSPGGTPFSFHVVDLQIAADGDAVHVVWQDQYFGNMLWHQASSDLGASWGPAMQLANGQLSERGQYDVAVVDQRVAVAYAEVSALCGVSAVISDDGGATWSAPSRVGNSLSPACIDRTPSVFLAPQHVVVGWADDRTGIGARPYAAWSDDLGATWTEQQLFPAFGEQVRIEGNPQNGVFGAFWNGQAQAYVSWSRTLVPMPGTVFTLTAAPTGTTIEDAVLSYDPLYGDFLCTWRRDDAPGSDALFAAGFRNAQFEALGTFLPGSQLSFAATGFPETETGNLFQVCASFQRGAAPLPTDGRSLGLARGALLNFTVGNPAFQGTLLASGVAATPLTTLPPTLPPGTVIHFAAVSQTVGPVMFDSLTDVITHVVQ